MISEVADGDPVNAADTNAPIEKLADEVAALKSRVAYLAEGKQLVAGLRINALTGAGPYTPGSAFNVASLTRTGSGSSARLVVTFTNAIPAGSIGFIQAAGGLIWCPDTPVGSGTTSISFAYFGTPSTYSGTVQDFNASSHDLVIGVYALS